MEAECRPDCDPAAIQHVYRRWYGRLAGGADAGDGADASACAGSDAAATAAAITTDRLRQRQKRPLASASSAVETASARRHSSEVARRSHSASTPE
jgi:hypothetical protein